MFFHKRFLISVCIFISAIIFCGVVEVVFTQKPALVCPTQCACIAIMVFWTNSIRRRITETRFRNLMLACGYLLISYFAFEIIKYKILDENIIWYFYYIPMSIVPLLSFYLSYEIYGRHLEKRKFIYPLLALPSLFILSFILTNDLHGLAFRVTNIDSYTYGPIYFAHIIWSVILLIGTLYFSIKGFYVSYNRKFGFILTFPIILQLVYTILYVTGNDPAVFGIHLWSTGTIFAATSIGILEMCIQLGLIPSNSNYEKIYAALNIPSGIFENSGALIFSSSNFNEIDFSDENYHFTKSKISGGCISAATNISEVNKLNKKLSIVSKKMQKRNEYLTSKNNTRKEKAEIEERNKIYDRIAVVVMPELEKIKGLLNEDFDKHIGEIAILNAYIKRRSNMELLKDENRASSSELIDALQESLEYVKLSGISTAFTCVGEGVYSLQMIIEAYNWFENILEGCFKSLSAFAVHVKVLEGEINIRLMISARGFQFTTDQKRMGLEKFIEKIELTKEGEDIIVSLHLENNEG